MNERALKTAGPQIVSNSLNKVLSGTVNVLDFLLDYVCWRGGWAYRQHLER